MTCKISKTAKGQIKSRNSQNCTALGKVIIYEDCKVMNLFKKQVPLKKEKLMQGRNASLPADIKQMS